MANIITTAAPVLAALFVAEDAARIVAETHQCDDNDNARCLIQYEIAHHPAETMGDLKTKLIFMVEQQMGDGMDWLPTILEDLQRIAPGETPEWTEALQIYEQATTNNEAALTAVTAAGRACHEDGHEDNARAYIAAEVRQGETSESQCAAIRALVQLPAPDADAVLVKLQIAIDTGMIVNPDLSDTLATDLRRFSNYANREA